MNIPLPKELNVSKPTGDQNAGLWYDKFFDNWVDDFSAPTETGKSDWVNVSAKRVGNTALLEEACTRIGRLAAGQNGAVAYFRTNGPFVTGLGREHPVGNGFVWHHVLGVPYLPGSSLKGILRAFARERNVPAADLTRMFGPDNRREVAVGSVIFFDAFPSAPVQLKADVMTPHYGPYYQDENGKTPPADWYDPTPIPFLAVAEQQIFVFACAPRRPNNEADRKDSERVLQWLPEVLDWLGAGAKTAAGYGRFNVDEQANRTVAEEVRKAQAERARQAQLNERLKGLGPLAQELEREIDSKQLETDKNAFSARPFIEQWLEKLENTLEEDAINRFTVLVQTHYPGLLENPDKVQGKKQKPFFSDRQRGIAKRLRALQNGTQPD